MAKMMGSLCRAGKVKYSMTRKVEKSNTDHSYSHQGRSKFRIKSSTNVQYKSGAYRLHHDDTEVISNSYHKYNCDGGYKRVEYIAIAKEQHEQKWKHAKHDHNRDTNHKKWHRNHPKEGFYQKREQFEKNE